jgi:hypothetical protein
MTLRTRKHLLLVSFTMAVVCLLPDLAAAQQVTYYDFDGVTASYTCTGLNSGGSLFCFNNSNPSPSLTNPALLPNSAYPAIIDPNPLDNPPASSNQTSLQISDGTDQYSSAWFAVPQKVLNGFTAYVAFRLTPISTPPGDGIAFVIQNASGGGTDSEDANDGSCVASISGGLGISATIGGCLGYGGIDNSLAVEFDTYQNEFDPNANHIAIQSCGLLSGVGQPNSPNHTKCLVNKNTPSAAINSDLSITLADGNVHQAVIEYSGPTEATPNQWQVYIDPVFIAGTHTPDTTQSTAVITTTADLTQLMTLQNSGSAADSAFVGFTGASGGAVENQEILAWTFTPHTTSTQQQPISNPGTPTTFPFGAHTYAVNYPQNQGVDTSNIDMVVVANTLSPSAVSALLLGSNFAGSACQQYDSTGGNCVIYSVYCVTAGTTTPAVPCPATADPLIAVKTAFDSDPSLVPLTPGFLQGDPLYSQIASIQVSGTTATVTCSGECAVHDGETVSILNATPPDFNATNVTVSNSDSNVYTFNFTYASIPGDTYSSGAFVTSNNLQNICNAPGAMPPCWQAPRIDGTISGTTKNFSDFVALFSTVITTGATISAPPITYGQTALITVSVTPVAATGNVSLTVGTNSALTMTLSGGSATFDVTGLGAGPYNLSASYLAQGIYGAASATGTLTVGQAMPAVTFTGAPAPASPAVFGSTFVVTATTNASTTPTIVASGACSVGAVSGSAASASATVTMTAGTGTCSLTANWAADPNYSGTSLMQSAAAGLKAPTVTFTGAPTSPTVYGSMFVVHATTNASTTPTIVAGGACSVGAVSGSAASASATVTMTSGTSTCGLTANWAADPNYSATSLTQSTPAGLKVPTVTFSGAPTSPTVYGSMFAVHASTNASSTPTILGSGACSVGAVSGTPASTSATVTMTSGTGACSLTANWAADSNYAAALLTQSTPAMKASSVITWIPASIQLGYPLTTAQLDATANVPGAFTYTPPLGTVVSTSSQSVLAQFTPAAPANYNSASESVPLTVTPGPLATVSPTMINFGTAIYLGSIITKPVTLTNTGNAAMTVSGNLLSLVKGGDSNEFVEVNLCPKSLAPGKSCTITIAFVAGPFYTPQTATLSVMDNAPGNPQTVALTATVINPQAALSTNSLSFGNQRTGTSSAVKTITLKNTEGKIPTTALTINSIALAGADAADFSPTTTCPMSPGTLAPGSSCTISVVFKPAAKGSRSATLTIKDNAQTSQQSVALSGTGTSN